MTGFSKTSAAATCVALAQQAHSTAFQIDALLADKPKDSSAEKLAFVSTRLQQFAQHGFQLGECLEDAKAVSPRLQAALSESLPECAKAMTTIVDEIAKVGTETPVQLLDAGAAERYSDVVAAISRMFIFATQISTVDLGEEQDVWLAHPEAKGLFDAAGSVSQQVVSSGGILAIPN